MKKWFVILGYILVHVAATLLTLKIVLASPVLGKNYIEIGLILLFVNAVLFFFTRRLYLLQRKLDK